MLNRIISVVLCLLLVAACAQDKSKMLEPQPETGINRPLSEKCQAAKQDFDNAIKAGDQDNLRELKRNIELYCVWRRY